MQNCVNHGKVIISCIYIILQIEIENTLNVNAYISQKKHMLYHKKMLMLTLRGFSSNLKKEYFEELQWKHFLFPHLQVTWHT